MMIFQTPVELFLQLKPLLIFVVIYPAEQGVYGVVYFVPGGPEGAIPAEWYTDFLTRVVKHGFIAVAVDPFYPALDVTSYASFTGLPDKLIAHLQWVSL